MLTNMSLNDAKLYTDIQGLSSLSNDYKKNPKAVNKEVAEQFESLLVQMLLSSMRNANKAFSNGLFEENEQSAMYKDLYDKQLALTLSKSGSLGLSKQIEEYLNRSNPAAATEFIDNVSAKSASVLKNDTEVQNLPQFYGVTPSNLATAQQNLPAGFDNADDFVKHLWSSAKSAAQLLGTDPKILLAQAALETNWGKRIIHHAGGDSTHNLFNIKAGEQWKDRSAVFNTIEEEAGVLTKQRAKFRSYSSYSDSFADYANLLKHNERYSEAIQHASSPEQFVAYLQKARYATDEKYSEKIMDIYSSSKFNDLFNKLNLT